MTKFHQQVSSARIILRYITTTNTVSRVRSISTTTIPISNADYMSIITGKNASAPLLDAVNLKLSPPLINLHERRQLIAHLRARYGDPLVFRSLVYDANINAPDSALVIFRDRSAFVSICASATLEVPIRRWPEVPSPSSSSSSSSSSQFGPRYEFSPHPPRPTLETVLKELKNPGSTSTLRDAELARQEEAYEPPGTTTVTITVKAEPWKGNHRGFLERNAFWNAFKVNHCIIQEHIAKRAPVIGLSDVHVHQPAVRPSDSYRRSKQLAESKSLKEWYRLGLERAADAEQSKERR